MKMQPSFGMIDNGEFDSHQKKIGLKRTIQAFQSELDNNPLHFKLRHISGNGETQDTWEYHYDIRKQRNSDKPDYQLKTNHAKDSILLTKPGSDMQLQYVVQPDSGDILIWGCDAENRDYIFKKDYKLEPDGTIKPIINEDIVKQVRYFLKDTLATRALEQIKSHP